jgi:hypothetical protein
MSEYQYYEFAAIDQPLTGMEMSKLRAVSSRAVITPNGFTNHYHWGSLKADTIDWMRSYFDAFVYSADWCSCELALRLPKAAFDENELLPFISQSTFRLESSDTHWILWWTLSQSEDYDRFAEDDGIGWMRRLMPLRDELLRGDLRSLYLSWLAAADERTDDELEPEVPAGLADLSPAQQALVEFMEIDLDLLEAACAGSAADTTTEDGDAQQVSSWLETLQLSEMKDVLKRIALGHGVQAQRQIKTSYAAWIKTHRSQASSTPRRQMATLNQLAQDAAITRQEREAKARAQRAQELLQERESELRRIMTTPERYWAGAQAQAARGNASGYEKATQVLKVLAQGYELASSREAFERELQAFVVTHAKRPALIRRLKESGLWTERRLL